MGKTGFEKASSFNTLGGANTVINKHNHSQHKTSIKPQGMITKEEPGKEAEGDEAFVGHVEQLHSVHNLILGNLSHTHTKVFITTKMLPTMEAAGPSFYLTETQTQEQATSVQNSNKQNYFLKILFLYSFTQY